MLNNILKAKNLTKLTNEIDDYYKNGILSVDCKTGKIYEGNARIATKNEKTSR